MALCWLITYENEGKKGNDFSTIKPFDWLVKYRKKLPNLILVNWSLEDHPLNNLPEYDKMINIEDDYPELFKEPEPEIVPEIVQDVPCETVDESINDLNEILKKPDKVEIIDTELEEIAEALIDPKEELKKKRVENLKKAREAKKKKVK